MTAGHSSSVATILAAALLVGACGSDSSSSQDTSTASPVPAATTPAPATTAATTPATTTTTPTAEVSAGGETMALGTRVVAPYVVYGKNAATQQNTTLGVTVLRIRKGRISDFKDFNLDAKQKQTVPYFVEVKYENLGKLKLQRFLLDPSIEDSGGQEYKPLNLIVLSGTFKKCPQPSRSRLRGGQTFTLCAPFLLRRARRSSAFAFRATSRRTRISGSSP
jgi:hypothetical protein